MAQLNSIGLHWAFKIISFKNTNTNTNTNTSNKPKPTKVKISQDIS